jgi:hypoxanthine phosphoribosyltransferase
MRAGQHYHRIARPFISERQNPGAAGSAEYHMAERHELLAWNDVDKLIDVLVPQFRGQFDAMVIITRGGVVPGGLISEVLDIKTLLTASVDFPEQASQAALLAWPNFLQFPDDSLLKGKRILVVDDVWGSGRTITAVKNRILSAGGLPELCVLHYNPHRSLFGTARPEYYGAVTDARIIYPWEGGRGLEHILIDHREQEP